MPLYIAPAFSPHMSYKSVFTEKEYNSPDGMNVNIWGKAAWTLLHCISFNYPVNPTEEQKKHYHDFLMSLKNVLPCKACRDNYGKNLEAMGYGPDCLENRKSFSLFIYRLHNCVNKMIGKPCSMTFHEVRDRYEMFRARCLNATPKIAKYEVKPTKEKGCDVPLYGIKSKTVIKVVPMDEKIEPISIDPRCVIKKVP